MPRHQFVVLTEAVPGREAEFEEWYDNQHLPDLLKVPGIVGAQRFNVQQVMAGVEFPKWVSLAIYEIESGHPQAVIEEIMARSGGEQMPLSEALIVPTALQVLATAVKKAS